MKKPKKSREEARKKAEKILSQRPRDIVREANELVKPPNVRYPQEDTSEDE
jgi:hypothetical protein